MSIRKILSIVSLVSIVPIAACDDDSDAQSGGDAATQDAGPSASGSQVPSGDGSTPSGDASAPADASVATDATTTGSADAGSPSPATDGGVSRGPVDSDASAPAPTGTHLFLPTGEPDNTAAPVVEVDAAGNVHTLYPAYAGGGAYYAFCAAGTCAQREDAKVVAFETDGTVGNAMLALTADGKPRVVLSSFAHLYWAECDQGCTERANWKLTQIMDHGGDRAATGEALALDPQGHPRFLLHTYRALFGIGQKPPQTLYAQCDAGCDNAANWRFDVIAKDEIWEGSSLRIDATGKAHVATFVFSFGDDASDPLSAYLSCEGTCNAEDTWKGIGFLPPYESMTEAVNMNPAISLALTKASQPRVAMIGKSPEGNKRLSYFACDTDCTTDHWTGGTIFEADAIDAGIDLALDQNDRPRIAHTLNYNIILTYCDAANCTQADGVWESSYVEKGSHIPPDNIFLEWNCTIGAWFLHSPSLALTSDGRPRVGYQSRDISGGFSMPDPTKPACVAGTDMTWSRLSVMSSYK